MASLADAVAADVWKRVMVFTTPLEWLRSSVAGHRLFGVFRLYLPGLVESATLPLSLLAYLTVMLSTSGCI